MEVLSEFEHFFKRTLRIETPSGSTASAFVMTYKDREWIVTAKHVVKTFGNQEVTIRTHDGTALTGLKRLPESVNHIDVAVYRLAAEQPDFGPPLRQHNGDVYVGQATYFSGFPGLGSGLAPANPNVPYLKRAMVSGQALDDDGTILWLLDGMNVGGFSGGPVVARQKPGGYRVFAVVCSFVPTELEVNDVHSASGDVSEGRAFVRANSGLMTGSDISHATAAMDNWLGSRPPS